METIVIVMQFNLGEKMSNDNKLKEDGLTLFMILGENHEEIQKKRFNTMEELVAFSEGLRLGTDYFETLFSNDYKTFCELVSEYCGDNKGDFLV